MYKYENHKEKIFTEKGQVDFLKVRDRARLLLKESGAFKMDKVLHGINFENASNVWDEMANVDRLVELKEIFEIPNLKCAGQNRIFIKG